LAPLEHPSDTVLSSAKTPAGLRLAAIILRSLFICELVLITIGVALPQNETIWTAYDTPADLVRLILGLGVCVWLATQLFRVPEDPGSYRTWVYLGFVAVPFASICLYYTWFG
jgi:hypothetical protein